MEYKVLSNESVNVELAKEKEGEIEILKVKAYLDANKPPEAFRISFYLSAIDCYSTWSPTVRFGRALDPNWNPRRTDSKLASWMPVHQIVSIGGMNRITIAVSDTTLPIQIKTGVYEEKAEIECTISFFTELTTPRDYYEAQIRIDTRNIPHYDSIYDVNNWWENDCGYTPAYVPEAARLPMDSLWYSFHQNLKFDEIVEECRLSKAMGMETVIIDDGWQTDNNNRGYRYCGDWQLATGKIYDMQKLVDTIHDIGMKVMLWFSVPFVGRESKNFEKFKDMYLYTTDEYLVLDPRYTEVCDFLVNLYKSAVIDWNLDGLKLDFIDCFYLRDAKENVNNISLEAALDRLMTRIKEELLAVNPDILIEFRQSYIGPSIRKYGNMLRVADCPNDPIKNREDVVNLRYTSGKTAVHSDMVMWNCNENVEDAALHIIPTLYGVPQISMLIKNLNEEHKRMLKFYLDFWKENRETLLDGKLIAYNPETSYSQVKALSDNCEIVTVYDNVVVEVIKPVCKIINSSKLGFVIVKNAMNRNYEIINCMGDLLKTGCISSALEQIDIPLASILIIK